MHSSTTSNPSPAPLAASATRRLAGIDLESGAVAAARAWREETPSAGRRDPAAVARAEQGFGLLASLDGRLEAAAEHCLRALRTFEALRDERGCGRIYLNLGLIAGHLGRWGEAHRHFGRCLHLARVTGDLRLQGLAHLSQAEVHMALDRADEARHAADSARETFERLGCRADEGDALRLLGVIFRTTGRLALAEARLRAASDTAALAGAAMVEGEALLELGSLYRTLHRYDEARTTEERGREILSGAGVLVNRCEAA